MKAARKVIHPEPARFSNPDLEIRLTDEQRQRWGLVPGARFVVEETPAGLILQPAEPALAKIYVEPNTRYNLQCRTCQRNTWQEPSGFMDMTV